MLATGLRDAEKPGTLATRVLAGDEPDPSGDAGGAGGCVPRIVANVREGRFPSPELNVNALDKLSAAFVEAVDESGC